MSIETVERNHPLLYAEDLGFTGQGDEKRWKMTIARITQPGVIIREDKKPTDGPVVHFKGAKKALELNKSNRIFIRIACGLPTNADLQECVGKQVELQVRFVDSFGGVIDPAIRVILNDTQMQLVPHKYKNLKCIGRDKPKGAA